MIFTSSLSMMSLEATRTSLEPEKHFVTLDSQLKIIIIIWVNIIKIVYIGTTSDIFRIMRIDGNKMFDCYDHTGSFFDWYPPKKLKYGKPRLGESTLT